MRTIETNWFKNASWESEQCTTHIVARSYLGLLRAYGNEGVLFTWNRYHLTYNTEPPFFFFVHNYGAPGYTLSFFFHASSPKWTPLSALRVFFERCLLFCLFKCHAQLPTHSNTKSFLGALFGDVHKHLRTCSVSAVSRKHWIAHMY